MRILQLTPRIPYPLDDGGKIGIFGITKYLALRGHEITLLSIAPSQNSDISGLREYCKVETVIMNTANSYLGMLFNLFSKTPYTISKYHGSAVLHKLKDLLQKNRFDIVHVDHLHMAYYGKFIKEEFGLPVVLREHNVESTIWERYYRGISNPLVKAYARLQFKKLYKYESKIAADFDRCLMITEKDKERIERMNPAIKACVIPAGVDTSYFHPVAVPIEPYSIVSVAAMDWPPNIEGILWFTAKIWPIIRQRIPQVKFYIVGKNPPTEVEGLAGKDIIVTGFVRDVREYMAKAAVFIVPLRSSGGMRIKILNALAMGKAVVSTSVGCEGIDVENGRNICIANTEKEFAERIVELLEDESKRKELGGKGLNLIRQKYQWERIAERIEDEYKKVLEGGV
ncbi:MAG: glycosyltransferase [Thermoplasmata archaeon]|nr:glycosyltransferase [Thermoplasmata archaeon]